MTKGRRTIGVMVLAFIVIQVLFLPLSAIAQKPTSPKIAPTIGEKEPRTLSGHSEDVTSVAYSPDGRNLASASFDKTIKIWDTVSGSLLRTLSGHSEFVDSLAYSPDGRTLASGSRDKTIKIWDTASGSLLRTLSGHSSFINSLAYSPDGRNLASGSDEIKVWDTAFGSLLHTLSGRSGSNNSLAYSPDGRTLASGCSGNQFSDVAPAIEIWDTASGSLLRTLSGHTDAVWSIVYSPDGRSLVSGSFDKTIKVWDTASGSLLRTLNGHSGSVYSLAYSPDGRNLASGGEYDTIKVWDTASGSLLRTLGVSKYVRSVAYSPNGRNLASASDPKSIKIWDVSASAITRQSSQIPEYEDESVGSTAANASSTDSKVKDKWALVIGVSEFAYSKAHPDQPSINLKYAAKDAQDFYNYLVTQAHFPKDHVLLLLNQKATRENIMAAFGDKFLPAVVRPGDQVVIYISTHGTPAAKDPAKRNFIIAHDTNPHSLFATGVNMDELYKNVQSAVKTDRALIVMDTCYSGAGVPGARSMDDGANFDAEQIAQGFGHLVVSSSAPNERSWESKVSSNGVFTKYLIQSLALTKGNLKQAFEKLSNDVQWEVQNAFNQPQHPKLGGKWEGDDFVISVSPTEHRPILNPELVNLMRTSVPAPHPVPTTVKPKQR